MVSATYAVMMMTGNPKSRTRMSVSRLAGEPAA